MSISRGGCSGEGSYTIWASLKMLVSLVGAQISKKKPFIYRQDSLSFRSFKARRLKSFGSTAGAQGVGRKRHLNSG